jgi:hypothetical protein
MNEKAKPGIKRRSFLGLLVAAAAFLLARLPWRRDGKRTVAKHWRRLRD